MWHALGNELQHAAAGAEEATELILEAMILKTGADSGGRLIRGESPLAGTALEEAIYVARGGTTRMRQLAAMKLADSGDARAVSTLSQLLFDRDAAVSDAALDSLRRRNPPSLSRSLVNAYSGAPAMRTGSTVSLRPAILLAMSESRFAEAEATLANALESKAEADSRRLRLTAEWLSHRA
jgi:hypothetical protein